MFAGQIIAVGALADPSEDQIQALKQQIQAPTEKVDALEQAHKTLAGKQTNAPFVTAGADGFSLQSADKEFILKLSGFALARISRTAGPATLRSDLNPT